MQISLLRILLVRIFKTITIILLTRFYVQFILLVRSLAKILLKRFLASVTFSRSQKLH